MDAPRKEPSEEVLAELRRQIQEWGATRKVPGAMPEEIWKAAAALAREFGACSMARALTLDYSALRKRAGKAPETSLVKPTFVQLPATLASEPQPVGATIEISGRDGARMRIQLEGGRGMDAAGIITAFLGNRG